MKSPAMMEKVAANYRRVAFLSDERLLDWRRFEKVVLEHDVDSEAIPEGLEARALRAWLLDFCARMEARAEAIREASTHDRPPSEASILAAHDNYVALRGGRACSPHCEWCNPDAVHRGTDNREGVRR